MELLIWIAALIVLFTIQPGASHFTLCPISSLGFDFCPGCGIGHSIHYAMHFDIANSFSYHPLGIIAFFIIFRRIISLSNQFLKNKKTWTTNFSK